MPLALRLRDDWDAPLQPPDPPNAAVGHFVGRQRERELLANELLRSRQRSIFVSGYRGVGKTSLVYQALHDVLSEADPRRESRKFLVVIMNAAQLQADAGVELLLDEKEHGDDSLSPEAPHPIAPRDILLNLIRRLFTRVRTIRDKAPDAASKMDRLYHKAIAREFYERRHDRAEHVDDVVRAFKLKTNVNLNLKRAVATGCGIAAGLLASQLDSVASLGAYAPIVLAVGGALAGDIAYSFSTERLRRQTTGSLAETLYDIDASVGNLEFELEELHAVLRDRGYTVIYVLDELDKLPAPAVLSVLRYFKHLFTLSSAIFVFVGGEELMEEMLRQREKTKLYRSVDYTFFTSHHFLGRASTTDLAAFIDRVRLPDVLGEDATQLLVGFKSLVAFNSHGDFFDVNREIRDRVTAFDDQRPIIEIDRFVEPERVRIALQSHIDLLYNGKYRRTSPSQWSDNENVLRALYEAAHSLVLAHRGASVAEPGGDTPAAAAVRDLYTILNRQQVLEVETAETVVIGGVSVQIHAYALRALASVRPRASLDFFSEHERRFLASFDLMLNRVAHLLNLDRWFREQSLLTPELVRANYGSHLRRLTALGTDVDSLLSAAKQAYADLRSPAPAPVVSADALEAASAQVEEAVALLESRRLDQAGEILEKAPGVAALEWDDESTAGIDERLVEAMPRGSYLFTNTQGDRRLALTPGLSSALVRRTKDLYRAHEKVFRVIAFNDTPLRTQRPKGLRLFDWNADPPDDKVLKWSVAWLTHRDR